MPVPLATLRRRDVWTIVAGDRAGGKVDSGYRDTRDIEPMRVMEIVTANPA